jgi:hypothetical protein
MDEKQKRNCQRHRGAGNAEKPRFEIHRRMPKKWHLSPIITILYLRQVNTNSECRGRTNTVDFFQVIIRPADDSTAMDSTVRTVLLASL